MNNVYKLLGVGMITFLLANCSLMPEKKEYDLNHDFELIVHMKDVKTQKEVGTVTISPYIHDGKQEGMLITPYLYNLPASSVHGMHIHINPSCDDGGMAAGAGIGILIILVNILVLIMTMDIKGIYQSWL